MHNRVRITNFCKEPQKEECEVARMERAQGRVKEEMGLGRERENQVEDAGGLGPRKEQPGEAPSGRSTYHYQLCQLSITQLQGEIAASRFM